MKDPDFVIPWDRVPKAFAKSVDDPPSPPVEPRPAATIVLLRPTKAAGLEVLLLRRVRSAGFVPGAWVFPGGRVDPDDAHPELLSRTQGLDPSTASQRLGLSEDARPPAIAYYLAAVREAFEETGLLVAADADGHPPRSAGDDATVRAAQDELLTNESAFPSLLDELGLRIDGGRIAYVAHWITPEAEPRRYDTRFFAASLPQRGSVLFHRHEMSDALWLRPEEALLRRSEGELPMVFPTIRTLEALRDFDAPESALAYFRSKEIPTVLPRLVRTPDGVRIEVPE